MSDISSKKSEIIKSMSGGYSDIRPFVGEIDKTRLMLLTLKDDDLKKGAKALDNIKDSIVELGLNPLPATPSKIADMCVISLESMARKNPDSLPRQNLSMTPSDLSRSVRSLLEQSSDKVKQIGVFGLCRLEVMFDKSVLELLGDLPTALKSKSLETSTSDVELLETFYNAYNQIDGLSPASNDSLLNLTAHTMHKGISNRLDTPSSKERKDLELALYPILGRQVASQIYDTAINTNNTIYAKMLLKSQNHGFLTTGESGEKKGSDNASNDSKIKKLLSVIANSDQSATHFKDIISSVSGEKAKITLLKNVCDSFNSAYSNNGLAKLIEQIEDDITPSSFKVLSDSLLRNYKSQPTASAQSELKRIAEKKGLDVKYLDDISAKIQDKMNDNAKKLDEPTSFYSAVKIDLKYSNETILMRSIKSSVHLRHVLNNSVFGGNEDLDVTGLDSYLDNNIASAVRAFIENDDTAKLDAYLSKKPADINLHDIDKNRLVFDCVRQDQDLPDYTSSKSNAILSEVVDADAGVYSGTKQIALLSELRTANDFLHAVDKNNAKDLAIDATGLGDEFDRQLLEELKDVADNKQKKDSVNKLNDTLGLPLALQSSKMTNKQENLYKRPKSTTHNYSQIDDIDVSQDSQQDLQTSEPSNKPDERRLIGP